MLLRCFLKATESFFFFLLQSPWCQTDLGASKTIYIKAHFQVQHVQGFSVFNSSLLQVEMQTRQNPQTPPCNDDAVFQRIDWLLKLSQN